MHLTTTFVSAGLNLRLCWIEDTESGSELLDWCKAVELQRDVPRRLSTKAFQIQCKHDPKLAQLVEELAEIAAEAEREAINVQELLDKRKVVIFSYLADTVGWIGQFLFAAVYGDFRLASCSGRAVSVSSSEQQHSVSRRDAVFGFVPRSIHALNESNGFDSQSTPDVRSEAENLQKCRHIISYDLPWNPMSLIQRNGRIKCRAESSKRR